jgi:hypothetical protein
MVPAVALLLVASGGGVWADTSDVKGAAPLRAGFVAPTRSRTSAEQRHGRVATFAEHNLTGEEEAELVKFLGYLRSRKKS